MAEVVDDFRLGAVEALQRRGAKARIGQQRQLDPGDPAFGHRQQAADVGLAEGRAAEVGVELLHAVGVQAQVLLVEAEQLVGEFQAGQGKARMVAAGNDHADIARQPLQQGGQHLKDGRLADVLEVVEHQAQAAVDALQGFGQVFTDHLRRQAGFQRVEPRQVEVADLGANAFDQPTEEAQGMVVAGLQRVIGQRAAAVMGAPVAEQGRLARTGRGQ